MTVPHGGRGPSDPGDKIKSKIVHGRVICFAACAPDARLTTVSLDMKAQLKNSLLGRYCPPWKINLSKNDDLATNLMCHQVINDSDLLSINSVYHCLLNSYLLL